MSCRATLVRPTSHNELRSCPTLVPAKGIWPNAEPGLFREPRFHWASR